MPSLVQALRGAAAGGAELGTVSRQCQLTALPRTRLPTRLDHMRRTCVEGLGEEGGKAGGRGGGARGAVVGALVGELGGN